MPLYKHKQVISRPATIQHKNTKTQQLHLLTAVHSVYMSENS